MEDREVSVRSKFLWGGADVVGVTVKEASSGVVVVGKIVGEKGTDLVTITAPFPPQNFDCTIGSVIQL